MQKEKIKKTINPPVQPSFNEWCKEFNVSAMWVHNKIFDHFFPNQQDIKPITKLLKQKK